MQKQLQLSLTGNNRFELATGIKRHLTIGIPRQIIHRADQNLPLRSKTVQKHETLNRNIRSYIQPATTMQKQPRLS